MAERQSILHNAEAQREKMNTHKNIKQYRFGSPEAIITIIVICVITAILLSFTHRFVENANESIAAANAHNLYIAIVATLTIEQFDERDIADFIDKYSGFTRIEDFVSGENPVELSALTRLKNTYVSAEYEDPENIYEDSGSVIDIDGYIKLETTEQGDIRLLYSRSSGGENPAAFPKS